MKFNAFATFLVAFISCIAAHTDVTFGPALQTHELDSYTETDANIQGDYIYLSRPSHFSGRLKKWKFLLNYDHVPSHIQVIELALRVYRPRDLLNHFHKEFEIVWEKVIVLSKTEPAYVEAREKNIPFLKTVELTYDEQLRVRSGDLFGWSYLNTAGVVPFKVSYEDSVGESWNRWRALGRKGEQHWQVGHVVSFYNGDIKDQAGFTAFFSSFRFVPQRQYGIHVDVQLDNSHIDDIETTGFELIDMDDNVFALANDQYQSFDSAMQSDYMLFGEPIQKIGRISSWTFMLGHEASLPLPKVTDIRFRVYRPHYHHNGLQGARRAPEFELIGENKFQIMSSRFREESRVLRWSVPKTEQIHVRPGDLIGWTNFNSYGVIAYADMSSNRQHLVLDNFRRWRARENVRDHLHATEPHWTVGDVIIYRDVDDDKDIDDVNDLYTFTKSGHRSYAITADIEENNSVVTRRPRFEASDLEGLRMMGNSIEAFATVPGKAETDASVQSDYILLNHAFESSGRIAEWKFLADTRLHGNDMEDEDVILVARVFRKLMSETENAMQEFQVVGENYIPIQKNYQGVVRIRVPTDQRIAVQAGDYIGWTHHNSRGLIPFKEAFGILVAENPTRWREGNFAGSRRLRVGSRVSVMANGYDHRFDHTFRIYHRYYPFQAGVVSE